MMSSTVRSPRSSRAAEHVAIGALDVALLVQQVDGAFQLLGASEDRHAFVGMAAEQLEHAAHQHLDRHEHRPEDRDERRERAGQQERAAVGVVDRNRLRQHLREDQQEHRHDGRRPDRAVVADHDHEDARHEGRRADVDQRVTEERRADQTLAPPQQAIDQRGAFVTVALQRMHPGARGTGESGFRRREEGGENDAEEDDRDRDPDIDGQRGRLDAMHGLRPLPSGLLPGTTGRRRPRRPWRRKPCRSPSPG